MARIKGHYRKIKGKRVWIKGHTRKKAVKRRKKRRKR